MKLDTKEAKEIISAGSAWANWTDKQKQAFKLAYDAIETVKEQHKEIELLKADNELLKAKWEAQGLMIQNLHKEIKKYKEVLKEIADSYAFDDIYDEVTTKRFIAKQALEKHKK
jgi:hypothetical protein